MAHSRVTSQGQMHDANQIQNNGKQDFQTYIMQQSSIAQENVRKIYQKQHGNIIQVSHQEAA